LTCKRGPRPPRPSRTSACNLSRGAQGGRPAFPPLAWIEFHAAVWALQGRRPSAERRPARHDRDLRTVSAHPYRLPLGSRSASIRHATSSGAPAMGAISRSRSLTVGRRAPRPRRRRVIGCCKKPVPLASSPATDSTTWQPRRQLHASRDGTHGRDPRFAPVTAAHRARPAVVRSRILTVTYPRPALGSPQRFTAGAASDRASLTCVCHILAWAPSYAAA
jgi:hypothetical protein